ncbi:hypothetical protein [Zeaxanthinibacter enoshimensis]|uniref:Uncharacterized protein n=1 Tax=Zeaxanthinibacter enoshimensis TaxID=392009 RepID=A0A4V3D458_9FLAO|nr:hypothetical protein [Zeaxanthinibacter enoshimensis]TDQ33061.1 hypothetical protein CLV82_0899 [Zeaxanthinibacter enoshimensis]
MKNVFIYYLCLLAPLALIYWLYDYYEISSDLLAGIIIIYLLAYKSYLDGRRLVAKNILSRNEIWIMIIPGNHLRFFKELYLD